MDNIWFALWFFLPAGVANVTPVFLAKIPVLSELNAPVDKGLKFKGKRILGDHKTWRGLIGGIIAAMIAIFIEIRLFEHNGWVRQISMQVNYSAIPAYTLGFLLGFGALLGDMVESFIKRQLDVKPGHSWFPYDQLDYIVGALILGLPVVRASFVQYVWMIILWFGIHLITSYFGYYLHFKSSRI